MSIRCHIPAVIVLITLSTTGNAQEVVFDAQVWNSPSGPPNVFDSSPFVVSGFDTRGNERNLYGVDVMLTTEILVTGTFLGIPTSDYSIDVSGGFRVADAITSTVEANTSRTSSIIPGSFFFQLAGTLTSPLVFTSSGMWPAGDLNRFVDVSSVTLPFSVAPNLNVEVSGGPVTSLHSSALVRSSIRLTYLDEPRIQRVGLAWNVPVPRSFTVLRFVDEDLLLTELGETRPADVSAPAREEIFERVVSTFEHVGIQNIEFENRFVAGATNVYFADSPYGPGAGGGEAFTGVDRFNQRLSDGVVVFLSESLEKDAETAAHELGHAFGLRHVGSEDGRELMDSTFVPLLEETFLNSVRPIADRGESRTHNPVYHLEHYIDGTSSRRLAELGIEPGEWDRRDESEMARLAIRLGFEGSDHDLFGVHVLTRVPGGSDSIFEQLAFYEEVSLFHLSQQSWTIDRGDELYIVAASALGGELDVVLSTGNPFELNRRGIIAMRGTWPVMFHKVTGASEYATIAEGVARVNPVPEPPIMALAGFAGLTLQRLRELPSAKRKRALGGTGLWPSRLV